MIDSIHYYSHGRPGFKLTSSASVSYDRPLTAVEIYGNYSGEFERSMLYRSGMELFARGANLFIPHGMWYDPETVRIPPLISHLCPRIGPSLWQYNEWIARSSLLLQNGRHVADIGVLYPVATMQAYTQFGNDVGVHPGLRVPPETDFNQLSDLLTGQIRRDFTFLHPEIIDQRCGIDGTIIRLENEINFQEYRIIIIPGGQVIHLSNLQKLRKFYEAGGIVVATTHLPSLSAESGYDREVVDHIEAMFTASVNEQGYAKKSNAAGGASYFIPSLNDGGATLHSALKDAVPVANVRFGSNVPSYKYKHQPGSRPPQDGDFSGMLSYIHKVQDGRNIYFFANSTDEHIDTEIHLRGKFSLQSWNPHSGLISDLESEHLFENGLPVTRARLRLEPIQSMFWVELNGDE